MKRHLLLLLALAGCGDITKNVNGLTVDAQGNLVIAYGGYNLIRVVDPATGATVREVGRGVRVPDDVETDRTGALWWTSLLSGEVGLARPDGQTLILADLGAGANSIALSPSGKLIVGRCGLGIGNDLFAIDAFSPSTPETVFPDVGTGCSLNGMVFGADGWLYGAQPTQGRVVRVRLETRSLEVLAEGLSGEAYAVALDAQGQLFALDGKRVVKVEGGQAVGFLDLPVRGDNLVFSADGSELFVSTGPDLRVLAFDGSGAQRVVAGGP